jgi:phosphoribosylformimino-5-aminoimidazole carboxamide ribonucleotide (ProFAR) isomerase
LAAGAARVVMGTAALRDPALVGRLVSAHGSDKVAVAIDVRGGRAIGHAWTNGDDETDPVDAIRQLADVGVETFEVTAIERDGRLSGPNLELHERLVAVDRGSIIASGGVTSLDHLMAVQNIGCVGAIVGRAFYEGRLDLREAMSLMATME